MTSLPAQTVLDALRWRSAVKKMDAARKIPEATWAGLEEALVLSPSSFGLQAWRFVVVTDGPTKQRLAAASHDKNRPVDCSHLVVFAARRGYNRGDLNHYVDRLSEVRAVPRETLKGYSDSIAGTIDRAAKGGYRDTWVERQVYIALGVFLTSSALVGVDVGPMEGIDTAKYDEILALTAMGYGSLCACAAGYRSAEDNYSKMPKVRFKKEEVILHV
jgi:nitroreductase